MVPHKGDEALFWDLDNLACLCADCHEAVTIEQEQPSKTVREQVKHRGYSDTPDAHGYPIDPRHPFNEVRPI
jgi:5-methylcytosine-specific restriction endonuclease McrA